MSVLSARVTTILVPVCRRQVPGHGLGDLVAAQHVHGGQHDRLGHARRSLHAAGAGAARAGSE